MSTIQSYFNKRKARQDTTPSENFAARAPEPVYNDLKKVEVQKKQQTPKKTSILYYLTPVTTLPKDTTTEIVETILPCPIRMTLPVSTIWKEILEEFDPQFNTTQVVQSLSIPTPHIQHKGTRRRLEDEEDTVERNVRIRRRSAVFCLEDYLLEDVQEDLSRSLRVKYSTQQTNNYFNEIMNELLSF